MQPVLWWKTDFPCGLITLTVLIMQRDEKSHGQSKKKAGRSVTVTAPTVCTMFLLGLLLPWVTADQRTTAGGAEARPENAGQA